MLEEVAPEEAPTRTWEARQASVREFRPRRTLVALCVAVALTAAGVLAVAELALIRLRGRAHLGERTGLLWPAPETIGGPGVVDPDRLLWSDHAVLWTGAVIAAFGVLLLLSALLPGRTRHVPLGADHPDFLSGLTRSGMRKMLVATATAVPGIDRATVRLRGRFRPRAVVRVTTNYRNPGRFAEQVREAVQARLEAIDPVRVPRVVVRLRWRDK